MHSITCGSERYTPSKVVCIGRNYVEHIEELGNEMPDTMVLFNKPNSALSETLRYVDAACRFEGEICFLVRDRSLYGVGFGLDLTRADVQQKLKEKGLPWERAKAFDGSAVLGAFVRLDVPLQSLRMELWIDGALRQHADYGLMIHKPETMLEEIGNFMTLEEGDVIMSGTPKGVSTFARGERFVGKIFSGDRLLIASQWQVE